MANLKAVKLTKEAFDSFQAIVASRGIVENAESGNTRIMRMSTIKANKMKSRPLGEEEAATLVMDLAAARWKAVDTYEARKQEGKPKKAAKKAKPAAKPPKAQAAAKKKPSAPTKPKKAAKTKKAASSKPKAGLKTAGKAASAPKKRAAAKAAAAPKKAPAAKPARKAASKPRAASNGATVTPSSTPVEAPASVSADA